MKQQERHQHESLSQSEQEFLARSRQLLDQSCDALDGHTLSRLNSIRHQALERSKPGKGPLATYGGLLAACLVVAVLSVNFLPVLQQKHTTDLQPAMAEDIDVLVEAESLELYENYEFYQWLADNG